MSGVKKRFRHNHPFSLWDYIYQNGNLVALKLHGTQAGVYYVINDHLGTPQQIVDATGTVVWKAAFLPFGKAQVLTETISNNIRFPGQYFDAETGLHYNWNRYYDPDTGRYLNPDPIGLAGGMNLYAYVGGDPVNFIDPNGQFIFTLTFGVTAWTLAGDAALIGSALWAATPKKPLPTYSKPKKNKPYAKPKGCPSGTKPIDQKPDLGRRDVHDIKKGVGAGPRDWTGISPDGDVITGDGNGDAVNNGPYEDYLP